jgi:hypothetical protein
VLLLQILVKDHCLASKQAAMKQATYRYEQTGRSVSVFYSDASTGPKPSPHHGYLGAVSDGAQASAAPDFQLTKRQLWVFKTTARGG